jgi:hypothetical protein
MTWATLRDVQQQTRIEFTAALASRHHFVQLPSRRWTRTLGVPGLLPEQHDLRLVHVRGKIWRIEKQ